MFKTRTCMNEKEEGSVCEQSKIIYKVSKELKRKGAVVRVRSRLFVSQTCTSELTIEGGG